MSFRDIGPLYCETPLMEVGATVPLEFWNTVTSVVPVLFGILVFLWFRERRILRPEFVLASLLLISVGAGSVLWHAFRTPLTLALDVIPGLLLFLLVIFLWPTYLKNRWWGYLTVPTIFVLTWLFNPLFAQFSIQGPPLGLFASVLCVSILLILGTWRRYGRRVALWGIAALFCALLAACFRTIDMYTCTALPFGSHFLWHIFLSLGAFLVLAMLGKMVLTNQKEERRN